MKIKEFDVKVRVAKDVHGAISNIFINGIEVIFWKGMAPQSFQPVVNINIPIEKFSCLNDRS